MKQNKKKMSHVLALVLLLAFAGAPQLRLQREVNAQDRNINVNEALDLNDLRIKNEVQRISSLFEAQTKFFKKAADLQTGNGLAPEEVIEFRTEGEQRKSDLATLRREFESLINKLKQGNHWDETFDARLLKSLKNASVRSELTKLGGARKVFQSAVDQINSLGQDIDDEVRLVGSKKRHQVRGRDRSDRVLAAHAGPRPGKVGCDLLFAAFMVAKIYDQNVLACKIAKRYSDKGCGPLDCVN